MTTRWEFYGRRDRLGGLPEKMRRDRRFFAAGRRRASKTALVQRALSALAEHEANASPALLVQLPDSSAADPAAAFRNAVREAGFGSRGGERGLPGAAAAAGASCAEGTTLDGCRLPR